MRLFHRRRVPLSFRVVIFTVASLTLAAAEARATTFGSLAQWASAPQATISIDDKNFVWLGDSGNWTGIESVNLGFFPASNAHSFGIDKLENYIGPLTLAVEYRVDITSSNVFAAVLLDQNLLVSGVTSTKDVYASLAELQDNTATGSGTVASLSIVDFAPVPNPPVLLPPVQSLWVRDTIQIGAGVGLQSISNTFFQAVPEPGTTWLATVGLTLAAAWRRGRRSPRHVAESGTAAP